MGLALGFGGVAATLVGSGAGFATLAVIGFVCGWAGLLRLNGLASHCAGSAAPPFAAESKIPARTAVFIRSALARSRRASQRPRNPMLQPRTNGGLGWNETGLRLSLGRRLAVQHEVLRLFRAHGFAPAQQVFGSGK